MNGINPIIYLMLIMFFSINQIMVMHNAQGRLMCNAVGREESR